VARRPRSTVSSAELDELIEQAIVDCDNESEQVTGLLTMLEEHLALPFQTTVLGATVTVARVDVTASDQIVAVCKRDGHRQAIPILDLPLPSPAPDGDDGWAARVRLPAYTQAEVTVGLTNRGFRSTARRARRRQGRGPRGSPSVRPEAEERKPFARAADLVISE
jgi:hypothetical protein